VCGIRIIYCTYNNTVEYTYGDVARFGRHQRRRSRNRRSRRRRNDAASGSPPPTHATATIRSLINSDLYNIMIMKFIISIHFNNILCSAALTGTVAYNIVIVVAVVVCAEFVFGNAAAGLVVSSVPYYPRYSGDLPSKQNTNHYIIIIIDNVLSRLSLRNIIFDPSAGPRDSRRKRKIDSKACMENTILYS